MAYLEKNVHSSLMTFIFVSLFDVVSTAQNELVGKMTRKKNLALVVQDSESALMFQVLVLLIVSVLTCIFEAVRNETLCTLLCQHVSFLMRDYIPSNRIDYDRAPFFQCLCKAITRFRFKEKPTNLCDST